MSAAPQAPKRVGPRERNLLIALGVIVVGAVAFLLLGGGSDEPITLPDPPPAPGTAEPDVAQPGAGRRSAPPLSDGAFSGRDPFEPLVLAGAGTGNGDTNGDTGSVGGRNGEETMRIKLVDIFIQDGERFAIVTVNGKEFTVQEGDRFADNFRLLDLTKKCGTFVFGDERFTLCIGQEALK